MKLHTWTFFLPFHNYVLFVSVNQIPSQWKTFRFVQLQPLSFFVVVVVFVFYKELYVTIFLFIPNYLKYALGYYIISFWGHALPYLLGGDSGSLPSWPPAFHHSNEAGEHHASCQDTENASKAMNVKRVATLSHLFWVVEVTRAVFGPPLEFQDVHVTILLEFQDSRMQERWKYMWRD